MSNTTVSDVVDINHVLFFYIGVVLMLYIRQKCLHATTANILVAASNLQNMHNWKEVHTGDMIFFLCIPSSYFVLPYIAFCRDIP